MERKDGFITVIAQKHDNRIIINVADNGVGITKEKLKEIKENIKNQGCSNNHIGLQNLYKRLILFYGEENVFMNIFGEADQSTQVLIEIPYKEI